MSICPILNTYFMLRLHEFYVSLTAYLRVINDKCLYLVFLKYQATLLTYKRNISILQGSSYPTMVLHYALFVPLTRTACPTMDNVIPYQWPERFSVHDHEKFNRVLSLECPYLALRCTFFIRCTRFLSSAKRPDRSWGPHIQLIPGIFLRGKVAGAQS